MKVGVVGIGIMGSSIARNLIASGSAVIGFDVAPTRCAELSEMGGDAAASAAEVAAHADIILTSLPSAAALDETTAAILTKPRKSIVVVELSTLPIEVKLRSRDKLLAAGIAMLDCPLSGTGAQAMVLGMKAGLDPDDIVKVIGSGAGTSRVFELRAPLMAAAEYGKPSMKIGIWQKDMAVIGEFATKLGVATPLFAATAPIYNAAMGRGLSGDDTAAVCAVIEAMSGITRTGTRKEEGR